ncbi:MAG: lysophospholipase [Clostridiales bacterium]|nr:lysophospholipase [Clostridiales bacterium]
MNLQVQEFSYVSHDGKTSIAARKYLPEGDARAILQICHGMCEYFGRYDSFARFMAGHGFIVCGNDHLGHGGSAPSPEHYGFFAETDGHLHLVEDVHTLTRRMQAEHPGLPVILLGHSMGSAIARLTAARYAASYAGAVFSGTPVQKLPRLSRILIAQQVKKHGPRGHSQLLVNLSMGSFNKRFSAEGSKNAWLSRDKAVVTAYDEDPRCTFTFSTSAYRDLLHMVSRAASPAWPKALPREFPVLVASGAMDPCGNFGKGVKKVFSYMQDCGMTHISLKLYPGARHEILNETNRDEVYADMLAWCENLLA